jgi:hypothetical protein
MADSITPPPELVQQWVAEIWHEGTPVRVALSDEHIAARAAQWGADQELEACCEYVYERLKLTTVACIAQELRADRRPKLPSLKEQARSELIDAYNAGQIDDSTYDTIRRALEALDD